MIVALAERKNIAIIAVANINSLEGTYVVSNTTKNYSRY